MKTFLISALAAGLLSGCATNPQTQYLQSRIAATTPTCNQNIEMQCEKMWEAAQVWIVKNSAYKLQIATDVLLETYNPSQYDTGIAVRVLKEPTSNSSYKISVVVYCDNLFGCSPNQFEAALDFNNSVNLAKI
jgi:hypothetical protein